MDKVIVEGLIVLARVGVTDLERRTAQRCRVDLELRLDLKPAGEADDLAGSVDYERVVETVRHLAAVVSPKLLEALAEKLAVALLDRFGPGGPDAPAGVRLSGVRVRVVKLDPPLDAELTGAGVEIERDRPAPGSATRPGFI